ncbi:hypothetical protein [Candidatus Formimonas warabiya]|uniref:DUF1440 domain-containing protein n=1 Tax=Formimonas warabiya TaxID=1761012 RepID=A0A3G1KUQ4_FORW1|nr:hypothetical protein [Candidatus Formimonas warabiya]ATW26154.1 hypothetical protein DCMF_16485 [Candidatus Formimonas warabiya]
MTDTIQRGIYAGLAGSMGDLVIHSIGYFIFGTTLTAHYISQLIFPFAKVTAIKFAFGLATHLFVGAIAGILLALIFQKFGSDYPYYKGVGLGIVLWIAHVAVIPNLVAPRPYLYRTELEALVDLIAHTTFGVLSTLYLLRTTKNIKQHLDTE